MPNPPDLFAALEAAQHEIQEERRSLDAREAAIQRARDDLARALGGSGSPQRARTRAGISQKAAQHHLDAIADYLSRHQRARQADIAKALQLNSGTVSLALRQLEEDGVVAALPEKERNSVVWEASSPQRIERRSMSSA